MRRFTRQVVVRVDDEMHEALKANAAANGRTVAQSARFLLRQALDIEHQLLNAHQENDR